jgi:hypothetical protein
MDSRHRNYNLCERFYPTGCILHGSSAQRLHCEALASLCSSFLLPLLNTLPHILQQPECASLASYRPSWHSVIYLGYSILFRRGRLPTGPRKAADILHLYHCLPAHICNMSPDNLVSQNWHSAQSDDDACYFWCYFHVARVEVLAK